MDAGKLGDYRFNNYGYFIGMLLQRIEHISITRALTVNITTKIFRRFADDSHVRFKTSKRSLKFLDILNRQDLSIQYTTEFEYGSKQLSFLDVTITNISYNSYDLKIFRKILTTNVQIKPNSSIAAHITIGVFKGLLS